MPAAPAPAPASESLASLFFRFLRFGLLAWGGPVAQIAMVREELVEREGWVDPGRFNRAMAVYQALPGPEAHELCVYLGFVRRGRLGGLVAGLGFMLPGFVLMLAFSAAYVRFGVQGTVAAGLFAGFAPAVAALVLRAVRRLAKHALHDRLLWAIAGLAAAAELLGVHFALTLAGGGLTYAAYRRVRRLGVAVLVGAVVALGVVASAHPQQLAAPPAGPAASELREPPMDEVAAAGARAGLLTFGGAYTAIAFVEHDAVQEGRWLTRSQFLDGLAIGSSLPAPLIIFGTFVGYVGGGLAAALLMTACIFAPAFAFTLIGHRQMERLVEEPRLHALLDGVTAAVLGLMSVIAVTLLRAALPNWWSATLLVAALVVLARWQSRVAIVAVMSGAGALGIVATSLG